MNHFKEIYASKTGAYHTMIAAEDSEQNILRTIESIYPIEAGEIGRPARILDLGTGTGRLPLLFTGRTPHITGLDLHAAMLKENQNQRARSGGTWGLVQGDLRLLPFPGHSFDLVTVGWAMGHFCGWYPETWMEEITRGLNEIHRVVRPDGAIVILETLTTGSLVPSPPTPLLARYYQMLEKDWGFTRHEIRTDYVFDSIEDAVEKTEFFFGETLSLAIRKNDWSRLPEWTGAWGKSMGLK